MVLAAPANYTYKWYKGPITGIPTGLIATETTEALTNLAPGIYSVEVSKTSSRCVTTKQFEILGEPGDPIVIDNVISGFSVTDILYLFSI